MFVFRKAGRGEQLDHEQYFDIFPWEWRRYISEFWTFGLSEILFERKYGIISLDKDIGDRVSWLLYLQREGRVEQVEVEVEVETDRDRFVVSVWIFKVEDEVWG